MTAGMLLLASCSSDELYMTTDEGNVVFTASIPGGIKTRSSYDDGKLAVNLTYAVYDEDGNNIATLNGTETFDENLKTTVKLNLITGKTYTVVFWGSSPDASYYSFDASTGKMTVTPTGAANDKSRDAFFAYEKFKVTGAINKTVELKRPFAQINIGTSDLADFQNAGGTISTSGIKVSSPTVLDLRDGSVDETTETEYVYTPAALVAETEEFPVATTPAQRWLTTNYILVGDTKATVDVTWTSDNANASEVVYRHIPVQRNYRTNIYGALLTNPAEYEVRIAPGFDGSNESFMQKNADGTITCITPALPAGVTVKDLNGKGGVAIGADGNPVYFEATSASVNEAMKNSSEIYFAPNVVINTRSHQMVVPQSGITVHGNGATLSGQEQDFSVNVGYESGSSVDINISDLNGVKIWGMPSTGVVLNINLTNCSLFGSGPTDGSKSFVMTRGQDVNATVNINLDDCYMKDSQDGVHSIYGGSVVFNNCTFENVAVPLNLAKRSATQTADVKVVNCTFNGCGIAPDNTSSNAYNYAAPIRVVDNGGVANSMKLQVEGCTFATTLSEWDILLMDYRDGKTWFPVEYTVSNCNPSDVKIRAN